MDCLNKRAPKTQRIRNKNNPYAELAESRMSHLRYSLTSHLENCAMRLNQFSKTADFQRAGIEHDFTPDYG